MQPSPKSTVLLAVAALTLCWLGAAHAQQPAAPRSSAAVAGDLAVKTRSTFAPAGDGPATAAPRNPFLPIGYVRAVAAAKVEAAPEVRAEQFVVTSTLLDVPALAVINGKSYEVGNRIPVDATGKEFVTVKQIGDGFVVLDHRGRLLRCVSGLRRR